MDELCRLKGDVVTPQARGAALETLVARLFRSAHYRVEQDVGVARPRQTDLLAVGHREMYVVEVKWRAKPATVGDVHSLRSRLSLTQDGAVGVLVSFNGFTSTAVKAVEDQRDRPMLLIDGDELTSACAHEVDFRAMLRTKREALLWKGRVALASSPSKSKPRTAPAAATTTYVVDSGGTPLPWIAGSGGFGGFTFGRTITDPDWVPGGGASVVLHVPLSLGDLQDVAWALGELSLLGWATGEGNWCIAQAETNWHGTSPAGLLAALAAKKDRYADAGQIHHSEHVVYQDTFEDGFLTVSLEIEAHDPTRVWHAALSLQLSGIPLDLDPIRELCRTFEVQSYTSFRPQTKAALQRQALRQSLTMAPVAFLVQNAPDDKRASQWVCGIVVENPFHKQTDEQGSLPQEVDHHLAALLGESGLLVCDLRSWHPLGQQHRYDLQSCEWATTPAGDVMHMIADWRGEETEHEVVPIRNE